MRPGLVRRHQTPRQNWFLISPPRPNQARAAPHRVHSQLPIWKTSNVPPSSASSSKSKATKPSPDACSASAAPRSTANSSATTSAATRAPEVRGQGRRATRCNKFRSSQKKHPETFRVPGRLHRTRQCDFLLAVGLRLLLLLLFFLFLLLRRLRLGWRLLRRRRWLGRWSRRALFRTLGRGWRLRPRGRCGTRRLRASRFWTAVRFRRRRMVWRRTIRLRLVRAWLSLRLRLRTTRLRLRTIVGLRRGRTTRLRRSWYRRGCAIRLRSGCRWTCIRWRRVCRPVHGLVRRWCGLAGPRRIGRSRMAYIRCRRFRRRRHLHHRPRCRAGCRTQRLHFASGQRLSGMRCQSLLLFCKRHWGRRWRLLGNHLPVRDGG